MSIFKKFNISFKYAEKTDPKPQRNPVKSKRDYSVNHHLSDLEDGFFQDYVNVFQKQFDHLLEKNLKLVSENTQLKIDMTELRSESELFRIESKSSQTRLEKEKYLIELKLNESKAYVEDLLEESQILRDGTSKIHKDANSKLERYINENKELTLEIEKKDQRVHELREQVLCLEEEVELLTEDIVGRDEKINDLKANHKKYEDEILVMIEEVRKSHEAEVSQLIQKIDELSEGKDKQYSEVIQKKNETINKLLSQNEKIKDKFKSESEVVKKTFATYKETIKQEQEKNKELNVVLLEEKRKAQKLEELLEQQAKMEESFALSEDYQDDALTIVDNNTELEVAELKKDPIKRKQKEIGKVYEINNEKNWEIRGQHDGEYFSFLEIKDKLINKEINENTFLRKKTKWWKKAKEYAEFKLMYFTKEVNGKKKVYVERKSMRAPVNFNIKFKTLNKDFTGKCLNISEGGCFVEVKDFIFYEMREGEDIQIEFIDDMLSKKFSVKAKISSVIAQDKGLGVQFDEMAEDEKTIIKSLIDDFMTELDQAA